MDDKLSEFRRWLVRKSGWTPDNDFESGMAYGFEEALEEFDERFGA